MFFFDRPIRDRARAEATIGIRTEPAVPGKFYWVNDREVRWRPHEFWPVNTSVTVWAGGKTATTAGSGIASLTLAKGSYPATATKAGYTPGKARAISR